MCDKNSQTVLTAWFATVVVAAAATRSPDVWTLDIAKVLQGEWWRMISGHLVHLTWQHYLYDLLALSLSLLLCCMLKERFQAIAFTALYSAMAVSVTLLISHPVEIYGGISGVTAGLLSFSALRLTANDARLTGTMLMFCMLLKICLEGKGFSASGVTPVWQAHLAGATTGAVVSIMSLKQKNLIVSNREAGRIP